MFKRLLLRCLVFMVLLEALLRISGVLTPFFQNMFNRLSLIHSQNHSKTILFLGDSMSLGMPSYAQKVQQLVNKQGSYHVQVVNESMSAVSTGYLLDNLPDWTSQYHPDIVVVMSGGVNDERDYGYQGVKKKKSLYYQLHSLRLVVSLEQQAIGVIKGWFKPTVIRHPMEDLQAQSVNSSLQDLNQACYYFRVSIYLSEHNQTQKAEQILASLNSSTQKPYVRSFLNALQTVYYLEDNNQYDEALNILNELDSLDLDADSKQFLEKHIGEIFWRRQDVGKWFSYARITLEKTPYEGTVDSKIYQMCRSKTSTDTINFMMQGLIKKYPSSPAYLDIYASCLYNRGDLTDAESLHVQASNLRHGLPQMTQNNFKAMYKFLSERNIPLILVQYPRQDINSLKNIFVDQSNIPGLYFVDNSANFEKVLQEKGYNFLFEDQCCGNFGHCTEYGKNLIAKGVAATVLDILSQN